jgi:hypothetical protein
LRERLEHSLDVKNNAEVISVVFVLLFPRIRDIGYNSFDNELAFHSHLKDLVFEILNESVDDSFHLLKLEAALLGFCFIKILI